MSFRFRQILYFLCYGGISLTIIAFQSFYAPIHPTNYLETKKNLYLIGAIGALLIYQPHFIYTYQLNYQKGMSFILNQWKTFILVPVLSLVVMAIIMIKPTIVSEDVSGLLLFFAIACAMWHFSCQTVGIFCFHHKKRLSLTFINILKILFWVTSLSGLVAHTEKMHGEKFIFFGTQFLIPSILIENIFYIQIVLIFLHLISILSLRPKSFFSFFVWISYAVWFFAPSSFGPYFYLVPVFHSMQGIPHYIFGKNRITPKNYGVILFVSILILFLSLNILQYLENLYISVPQTGYLVAFALIFLNIHHAMMERFTWKK